MRVISGMYRGRKLCTPIGANTRPTLDRSKETIFNTIQHHITGARCLDLFAGSGQIGIELISRGASRCDMVDSSRESVKFIVQNISTLGIPSHQQIVLCSDYITSLYRLKANQYDIVYLDPPYQSQYYCKAIDCLLYNNMLASDAIVICESDNNVDLPQQIGALRMIKTKKVGTVMFSIYRGEIDE